MMAGELKRLLAKGDFIVAPGVFEMLSAKIADGLGFKALYMTGYGISASHLGLADAGLVTYRDMVERARTIAQGTKTPLIADADTGFGGLLNIRETVRAMMRKSALRRDSTATSMRLTASSSGTTRRFGV